MAAEQLFDKFDSCDKKKMYILTMMCMMTIVHVQIYVANYNSNLTSSIGCSEEGIIPERSLSR